MQAGLDISVLVSSRGSASCQRNSSHAVSGAVREAGRDREVAIWKDRPLGVTWWSHTGSVVLSCWLSAPSASQADEIEAEAAGERGLIDFRGELSKAGGSCLILACLSQLFG